MMGPRHGHLFEGQKRSSHRMYWRLTDKGSSTKKLSALLAGSAITLKVADVVVSGGTFANGSATATSSVALTGSGGAYGAGSALDSYVPWSPLSLLPGLWLKSDSGTL